MMIYSITFYKKFVIDNIDKIRIYKKGNELKQMKTFCKANDKDINQT